MKNILNTLLCAAITAWLVGCASTGENFDENKVSQIKKGETTEAELIQMFGKPSERGTRVIDSKVNTVLTWMYSEAQLDGKIFIPVVGPMMSGHEGRGKVLTVTLNSEGKVETFSYTGSTRTDTGVSFGTQK